MNMEIPEVRKIPALILTRCDERFTEEAYPDLLNISVRLI